MKDIRVVCVGIDNYGRPDLDRRGPVENAVNFARWWATEGSVAPHNISALISPLPGEDWAGDLNGIQPSPATVAQLESTLDRTRGCDLLILYWCGHGALLDQVRAVLTADISQVGSAYLTVDHIRALLRSPGHRGQQVVLVDACATIVSQLGRPSRLYALPFSNLEAQGRRQPDQWVLYSAAEGQQAELSEVRKSVFTEALLKHFGTASTSSSTDLVNGEALVAAVEAHYEAERDRGHLRQEFTFVVEHGHDHFRPVKYQPRLPVQLERERFEDLQTRFLPAVQPFRGRKSAIDELTKWLRSKDSAPRIVTGHADSGKTSLLAMLAVAASKYGEVHPVTANLELGGTVAAAFGAKGKSSARILQHIAYAAGLTEDDLAGIRPEPGDFRSQRFQRVVESLSRLPGGGPITVLVDGIDEADSGHDVCASVLAPIVRAGDRVRLLISGRASMMASLRTCLGDIPDRWILDLDDKYADLEMMRGVVRRALDEVTVDGRAIWLEADATQADEVVSSILGRTGPVRSIGLAVNLAAAQYDVEATTRAGWESSLTRDAGKAYLDRLRARLGDRFPALEDILRPLAYARGEGMPAEVVQNLIPALDGAEPSNFIEVGDLLDEPASTIESRKVGAHTLHRIRSESAATYLKEQRRRNGKHDDATIARRLIGYASRTVDGVRIWDAAKTDSYVGQHLIAHAAEDDGDVVESLATDGGFLLLADPAQVFTHCAGMESGRLRTSIAAYRDALPLDGSASDNAARLLFAARGHRDEALAASLMRLPNAEQPAPVTQWAAWRQETPHRRLSGQSRHTRLLAAPGTAQRGGLFSASGDELLYWSLDSDTATTLPAGGRVKAITTAIADDRPLVVAVTAQRLTVWDAGTAELLPGGTVRRGFEDACAVAAVGNGTVLTIIVGTVTGSVRFLQFNESRGLWTMQPAVDMHTSAITALAFVGKGADLRVVSASLDGAVRSWRYARPASFDTYLGHAGVVRVAVAARQSGPDGLPREVVATTGEDGIVRIWDPATPMERGVPLEAHAGWVRSLTSIRLRERTLLLSGGDDGQVVVWDVDTGTPVGAPYRGHPDRVEAISAVEVDGRVSVASAGPSGDIRIWELSDAGPVGDPFHGHSRPVRALCVLPGPAGTSRLASAGGDGSVILWDGFTGLPLGPALLGHDGWVGTLATDAAAEPRLATGGEDGRVMTARSTPAGLVPDESLNHASGGWISALTRVGDRWLWAQNPVKPADGPVLILAQYDGADPAVLYDRHTGWVRAIVTLELDDGGLVAVSAGVERQLHVWDPNSGAQLARVDSDAAGEIRALVGVRDDEGPAVLATGDDGVIRRFRPTSAGRQWSVERDAGLDRDPEGRTGVPATPALLALAALPDNAGTVIAGGADGTVYRTSPDGAATGLMPLARHEGPVRSLAIGNRAGRPVVFSGSADTTIGAWDLETGAAVLPAHTDWVRSVAVGGSDDEQTVVSASDDGTVRAWNLADGQPLWTRRHAGGRAVRTVACIGADVVVSGSLGGGLRLWDVRSGDSLGAVVGTDTDWVRCVAVSGDVIASGGGHGRFRLWRWSPGTKTMEPLKTPTHTGRQWVRAIAVVPVADGHHVATADEGGYLAVTQVTDANQNWTFEDLPVSTSADQSVTRALGSITLDQEQHIVCGGRDGRVYEWVPQTGISALAGIDAGTGVDPSVTALATHDGVVGDYGTLVPRLATASGRQVRAWSWISHEAVWRRDWELRVSSEVLALTFSTDAQRLVIATRMGVAVVAAG